MYTEAALRKLGLEVRPLERADRDALDAFFAGLSDRSRRLRFMSPKPRLSARELDRLVDVDHLHHEALVAVRPDSGAFVGVARYVDGELAVTVTDCWQRLGIGVALARMVVVRACESSLRRLTATTLWENYASRALLARLGFRARGHMGAMIELQLDLPGERCACGQLATGARAA
jgi:RimJ/RimL family protein N-acetyltransferase